MYPFDVAAPGLVEQRDGEFEPGRGLFGRRAGAQPDSASRGKGLTVELAFGDSVVHVGSEFPDMGIASPLTVGWTATVLQINSDDADIDR